MTDREWAWGAMVSLAGLIVILAVIFGLQYAVRLL